MDTRRKIIAPEQAPAGTYAIVTGYFDPLTVAHARRLEEIRAGHGPVIAVVLEPENPVLPARARAELLASLEAVRYVLIAPATLPEGPLFSEEGADEQRLAALIERVARRHSNA